MPIRVVFLGTPDFSVPCLQALLDAPDIDVIGAVTQPDRPSGRGHKLKPTPVKTLAQSHGVTVQQPKSLRKDADVQAWLRDQAPDFLVTIAFGQILPQTVLDIPAHGTVNVHASLLPRYRGANPIQRAIVEGCTTTGLTTMLTDIGVDTGDMLLTTEIPIGPDDTAMDLHDRLSQAAGPLLLTTLRGIIDQSLSATPQPHDQATHAPKGSRDDATLDWTMDAATLHNRIRGQQPWPGVMLTSEGQPLKILKSRHLTEDAMDFPEKAQPGLLYRLAIDGRIAVKTPTGWLEWVTVQPAGKKPMPARDWANGLLARGAVLPNLLGSRAE